MKNQKIEVTVVIGQEEKKTHKKVHKKAHKKVHKKAHKKVCENSLEIILNNNKKKQFWGTREWVTFFRQYYFAGKGSDEL